MSTAVTPAAAAASFSQPVPRRPDVALHMRDGRRYVMRSAQRFLGICLFLAALGVWLAVDAQGDAALGLSKLVVVLILIFGGAGLWQMGAPVARAELVLDLGRREIRLIRPRAAHGRLVQRTGFSELGRVEFRGSAVGIWLKDGHLLAEVAMPQRAARNQLRRVMQAEGVQV